MIKIVSLITARDGSKGIPDKNLLDINGKPLIAYSIEASVKSNVYKTYLSSDSFTILYEGSKYGSLGIRRPQNISEDTTPSELALLHFAGEIVFDILVFIQPTSPLIRPEYINKGIELIVDKKYDSVFSVTKEHWIPRWNTETKKVRVPRNTDFTPKYSAKKIITPNPIGWDLLNRPMRQDMPETYIENGMFYITTRKALLKSKLRYSGKIGMVEIPLKDSFQLDSEEDLELLEILIKKESK